MYIFFVYLVFREVKFVEKLNKDDWIKGIKAIEGWREKFDEYC